MKMPRKVEERIAEGVKRYRPIVEAQRARDVSEADTVTLVKDILADVFGYDKFSDLTSEYAIRGTHCDVAIKVDGKLSILLEVKAIGTTLGEKHLKQAVDYASNQGTEWVILTNGSTWKLYQVLFTKPVNKRLVAEFDISTIAYQKDIGKETLFVFSKEGWIKSAHVEMRDRIDATDKYLIGALLLHNDQVIGLLRRELRRVVDVLVDETDILRVLREEVIKRDVLEGTEATKAAGKVERIEAKAAAAKATSDDTPKLKDNPPQSPANALPIQPS